jgi:thiamine biosynthesis protein ThiS
VNIVVNGEEREAPETVTVLGLLETIGIAPGRVAVEVNGRIVRRADFQRVTLHEQDEVEVVHFVGGG